MDIRDWYKCGAQIGDLVQSAIDSGDFGQLNDGIIEAIGSTLEQIGEGMEALRAVLEEALR